MPGPRLLVRLLVVLSVAGTAVVVTSAPAHAYLTDRACTGQLYQPSDIVSGDGLRKLSICARGWVDDWDTSTRGVVELHTYARSGGGWVDARSQSITVNVARVYRDDVTVLQVTFGNDVGLTTCRVNGPSGSIACSVTNTFRVAFYSPHIAPDPTQSRSYNTLVDKVSWRDDRGIAHYSSPGFFLMSPYWVA
jgi:hypothetical protein